MYGQRDRACFTVSVTVVVWMRLPLVPVMVNRYVPSFVVDDVVIESLDEVPVAGLGLKVPETPEGWLETLKITGSVNPDDRVMDTVYVVPDPAVTDRLRGVADSEKSPAAALFTVCVNIDDVLPATLESPP